MLRAETLRLAAAFAAVYLIWGSTYLAVAVVVETIPPVLMVAVRGAVAGAVLYVYTRGRGGAPATWRELLDALPAALFLFGGGYVLVGWAEQSVASGPAALLNATAPAFVVLLEWLGGRRSRPGSMVAGGLVLGLAGVALLVMRGSGVGVSSWGALLLLLASASWAFGSVRASAPATGDPLRRAALQMLAGALLLTPVSLLLGEPRALLDGAVDARSLLALGYLIVFGSLIGYTAFVWLLHRVPAGKVASHAYVNPLIAVMLGAWLAREPMDAATVLSAALIGISVLAIVRGDPIRDSRSRSRARLGSRVRWRRPANWRPRQTIGTGPVWQPDESTFPRTRT